MLAEQNSSAHFSGVDELVLRGRRGRTICIETHRVTSVQRLSAATVDIQADASRELTYLDAPNQRVNFTDRSNVLRSVYFFSDTPFKLQEPR